MTPEEKSTARTRTFWGENILGVCNISKSKHSFRICSYSLFWRERLTISVFKRRLCWAWGDSLTHKNAQRFWRKYPNMKKGKAQTASWKFFSGWNKSISTDSDCVMKTLIQRKVLLIDLWGFFLSSGRWEWRLSNIHNNYKNN